MTSGKWHYYDEKERRTFQDPEGILNKIGLNEDHTLIDIGCGQGFFTLPAARIVGPRGKNFAIDSNPEAVLLLKKKATEAGLNNIFLAVQEAEAGPVCDRCADFVFLGIVLHDFRDPLKVLQNAVKMLKPGGKLINLDWKKETMDKGPPVEKRFDEMKAVTLMLKAGLNIQKMENCGQYTYLITAELV
ncbi:MAG TPA: methyltransferase domain-containing protein [Dehalococcoidales bacterium]|nr:methyltransferase domain-containing protein [Dehalococcoidales bacterium]